MFKMFFVFLGLFFVPAFADISISGTITEKTTENVVKKLKKVKIGSTVYVTINSQGGIIAQGNAIVYHLKQYKTVCLATKEAMSAAMYIFQSCTVRAVLKETEMMIHNIQIVFPPEDKKIDFLDLKNLTEQVDYLNKIMIGSIAYRMKLHPMTLDLLISQSTNKEFYIKGYEYVSTNSADLIVKNMKELKEKIK